MCVCLGIDVSIETGNRINWSTSHYTAHILNLWEYADKATNSKALGANLVYLNKCLKPI